MTVGVAPDITTALCVRSQLRSSGCRACVDACPAEAVELAPALRVTDACVGCGGCVGACPTGALDGAPVSDAVLADGFDKNRLETGELVLACARAVRVKGATVLPCLGRVTAELLCEAMRRGARRVALVAGLCEACDLRAAVAPLTGAVDVARAIGVAAFGSSAAIGFGPDVLEPLAGAQDVDEEPSVSCAPAQEPAHGRHGPSARRMDRRGFFRVLRRGGLPAVAALAPRLAGLAEDAVPGGADRLPRRARLLELIGALGAGKVPIPLPEVAPFGRVQIGASCFGCDVCSQVCLTGALRWDVDRAAFTLRADDRLCIACGACRDACLDHAIRVEPLRELPRAGSRILAVRRGQPCARCGRFSAVGALCRFCGPAARGRLRGAGRGARPC